MTRNGERLGIWLRPAGAAQGRPETVSKIVPPHRRRINHLAGRQFSSPKRPFGYDRTLRMYVNTYYNEIMKVALYSRVSTKDRGQDVENQQRQLRDFAAKQHGWTIVHEFSDNISGKTSDREQFKRMFIAASKREFDLLLFWSLSRLSREGALETLQHLQRLTSYGVAYRSLTEPYLDSLGPFRDGVISILACLARQERERLSLTTIAGLERARAQGRSWWASATVMRQKQSSQAARCRTKPRRNRQRTGRQQDVNTSDRPAIRNKGDSMKWLLMSLADPC